MMLLFPMFTEILPPMPDKDVAVSQKFIRMIVDFAENGEANWEPLDNKEVKYLEIGEDFTRKKENLPNQVKSKIVFF